MKRTIVTVLSIMLLLSLAMPALASELNSEVENENLVDINVQDVLNTQADIPVINLRESTIQADAAFTTCDKQAIVSQEVDVSSAIAIDFETSSSEVMLAADNQPPVANPEIFILNPESIRDGQYTTATQFFIATRWNNEDLCYDPEGGSISLAFNSGFPRRQGDGSFVPDKRTVPLSSATGLAYSIIFLQVGVALWLKRKY